MAPSRTVTGLDASFPAQPAQVAAIRHAVRDVATRCGADSETLVRLGLAVSEAATNVVLHAYREPGMSGSIHVVAGCADDVLDVCIGDHGVGMSPRPDSPGLGLGLSLMAGESDGCEIRSGADGGTDVLLRFELRSGRSTTARRRRVRDDVYACTRHGA